VIQSNIWMMLIYLSKRGTDGGLLELHRAVACKMVMLGSGDGTCVSLQVKLN
jgi:hypothetical protein